MSSRRSTKRKQPRRQRTLNKNVRRSSLPNTYVAALEDEDSDVELITDDDVSDNDPKEILEKIQEQKDIIANVRSRPWPMKKKLKVLEAARRYVEKHEGRLSKSKEYSEAGKEAWRKLKRVVNNIGVALTPWDMRIKRIESYFGSGVASYFIFLRWLVQINVTMGIITTAFLVVPEILVGNDSATYKQIPTSEKHDTWNLHTIWSLGGHLQHSVLFYGYYTNDRVVGNGYRIPLAYFLVGIATFAYSFMALLRKMAKNSRLNGNSSSEDDYTFSWRLFSSWDYTIGNQETAENKSAAITTVLREAIVEEQEKEKKEDSKRNLLIFLRIVANILVLLLLAGSLYSIQFAVSRAQELELEGGGSNFWEQNEVSIVVTAVTMITPSLFEVIGSMEKYHPRNTLRIQLARILMLYLGNLYSLMIGLLGHVAEATAQIHLEDTELHSSNTTETPRNQTLVEKLIFYQDVNVSQGGEYKAMNNGSRSPGQRTECWETYVGQELMKLSVIDLISTLLTILIVDFIRALFVRYVNRCCCWDMESQFPEYGEFKIAENVLHLIYNQGITWVGSFFCPVLPTINVIKLTLMMYVRSWAVVTCNVPHQRVFRASRSNNFYLSMLLFMLFLSLLPTVWVIVKHPPSSCGPFRNREWMHTIVTETLEKDVPSWLNEALGYLTTPVVVLPAILLLFMIIYYLQAVARSSKEANARLKLQLHYERKEGKKSVFLLGAGKRQQQKQMRCENNDSDFKPSLTPIIEARTSSPEVKPIKKVETTQVKPFKKKNRQSIRLSKLNEPEVKYVDHEKHKVLFEAAANSNTSDADMDECDMGSSMEHQVIVHNNHQSNDQDNYFNEQKSLRNETAQILQDKLSRYLEESTDVLEECEETGSSVSNIVRTSIKQQGSQIEPPHQQKKTPPHGCQLKNINPNKLSRIVHETGIPTGPYVLLKDLQKDNHSDTSEIHQGENPHQPAPPTSPMLVRVDPPIPRPRTMDLHEKVILPDQYLIVERSPIHEEKCCSVQPTTVY
uniref:transmembrane channel-like protein 3 n=1 Tax=Ciona intestinalis TaxID=7719 RepID=UPI00089DCACA|nr:transmembrane channel-like protein 3 [Ciona intestinalis]|eukprot:XP_018670245.1 transmembrane channel-like protein 3 [Ciona intestinalis]